MCMCIYIHKYIYMHEDINKDIYIYVCVFACIYGHSPACCNVHGAEVSCRDVIRQARLTRVASKGLKALGKVNLKQSETGCHRVFQRFGQSLPVKISRMDLDSKKNFPFVKFSAWLTYLVEGDLLENLVGVNDISAMQGILRRFWTLYKHSNPNHIMYHSNSGAACHPEMTIPVVHHGDEGRSHKKKQIMVLSTMGVLGRGSSRTQGLDFKDLDDDPLQLNMLGCTWLTHFLAGVLPISLYNEKPQSFYQFLSELTGELKTLFESGICIGGQRFFVALVGVKGDAPYLQKAGCLVRAFSRRPTRPSSKTPCIGICHLCLAGKEGTGKVFAPEYIPYEEFGSLVPTWLPTVGVELPYQDESPFLEVPFMNGGVGQEQLFVFDLFHNFHLGIGKNFAASAVCVLMELMEESIQGAFASLTCDFKDYCRRMRQSPYHKKLSATLFGVECSFRDCPEAGWSKGDYTRLILQWLGDYCRREVLCNTTEAFYIETVSSLKLCSLCFGLG